MLWWYWVVLGLVLAALELAGPGGFFIVFFGVGALAVGALTLLGFAGPPWVEWLLFSAVSVAALLLFRNPLLRYMRARDRQGADVDLLTNETATTLEPLAPGAVGRAELRGTVWSARNETTTPLAGGARCRVVRVDGLMLVLAPEGER